MRGHWIVLVILAVSTAAGGAPTPGQVNDFEDGTVQAWSPEFTTTSNITSNGPAGANDNYLQITSSGGSGSGGRMVSFNASPQWTGDFTSIVAIAMDLKNTSATARPIRLALRAANSTQFTPGYVSTTPFNLPNDGNWRHAVFNINTSSLTGINGPDPLATFLTTVGETRIVSSTSPALIGDQVAGTIGVDNITALVPEPSALALLPASALLLRRGRRR